MVERYSGRTALVVGGSGGIGAAFSRALAAEGAKVVVHGGTSRHRLDALVAELRASGADASGFLLPLDGPGRVPELHAAAPGADLVVCAFGPFHRSPLARTSAEAWASMALLDLALPGALVSAYADGMAARGWGRFLLFGGTSTDQVRGYTSTAAYSAAKAGIGVLAKSVALEYGGRGVSAVALCPGFVDTEYLDERTRKELSSAAPGGRLIECAELARLGLDLLVGESTNGAIVAVDGGLCLERLRELRKGHPSSV